MKYLLTKITTRKFGLSQGNDPAKNRITSVSFNSATSALNFVKNRDTSNRVYIAGTKVCVTKAIAKSLDVVKVEEEIKQGFPDVKNVKFKVYPKNIGNKTIVTLKDGRRGVSILQNGDTYDKMGGFLYAFKNARIKPLTQENLNTVLAELGCKPSIRELVNFGSRTSLDMGITGLLKSIKG